MMRTAKNLIICLIAMCLMLSLATAVSAACSIKISAPISSAKWAGTELINWTATGCGNEFDIFHNGNGAGYPSGTAGNIVDDLHSQERTYSWDTSSVSDGGNYKIKICKKNSASCRESSKFRIDNTKPAVSVTSPIGGSIVNGTIKIKASAQDQSGSGIAKVEFWHASIGTKIGEDTSSPYSISWDTTVVSDGNHDIWAVAYDKADNYNGSILVQINVGNCIDTDNDGYSSTGGSCGDIDCDDNNILINPGVVELCNGIDDNCNAETDEEYNVGAECSSSANSCGDTSWGFYVCSEDGVTCDAETPIPIDSDSDGAADCLDLCVSDPFKTDAGICGCGIAETDTDEDGTPDCIETDTNCDGIDNDGNGIADDGYAASETLCGTGACASTGLMQCAEGIEIDSCVEGMPSEETCNNIDDNCNGQIDEENGFEPLGFYSFSVFDPISQACYTGPEGTSGIGECASGLQTCSEGSWEESCSGEVLPAEEICDGLDNNCDGTTDEGNFTDADADGIKDCVDDDNDNDGISDALDFIVGDSSDINSDIPGLVFNVNNQPVNTTWSGIGNVTITSNGTVILEFEYDFSNVLDLNSINITSNSDQAGGSIIIKGINLTAQGKTKSAYINRVLSTNQLCIIDNEVDLIVIEGDCLNGIKLSCPGASGEYSCEVVDSDTRYKVSGLKHSAVSEYIYIAPASEPEDVVELGHTSGVLIVAPHNVPKPAEEAPAEEPVEEELVAEESVNDLENEAEAPAAQPTIRTRLAGITGRMVTSVKESPGSWGSGLGIAIAILLITSIYLSTRKVSKRFFKN